MVKWTAQLIERCATEGDYVIEDLALLHAVWPRAALAVRYELLASIPAASEGER